MLVVEVKYQENATTGPKKYGELSLSKLSYTEYSHFWWISLEAIVITLVLVRRLNDILSLANQQYYRLLLRNSEGFYKSV